MTKNSILARLPYIPEKFESLETAESRNKTLIGWLCRQESDEAIELAASLYACSELKLSHCNSGACHVCLRSNRLRMLKEIQPYIEQSLSSEFVTVIPVGLTVPRGELETVDMKDVVKRIAKGLRHILPRNVIAIGGIDVSINSLANEGFEWVVHSHIIVLNYSDEPTAKAVRSRLQERFKLRADCNKALRIEDVKTGDEYKVASYGLKSIFNWRSGFWIGDDFSPRARKGRPKKYTPKRQDEVELRLWLARLAAADRLVLVGVTNPAGPESIRLRDTPRTPKAPKTSEGLAQAKARVTRSEGVTRGKPR